MRVKWLMLGIAAAVMAASGRAEATPLLTSAYESKLEGWLGEGNLNFTNIFTKETGDGQDSYDFHAAADGKGRTFTLIEVLAQAGRAHQIIGGYNPQSWRTGGSSSYWNYAVTNAERTAFLYNLTTDELQRQNLTTDVNGTYGGYQTFNAYEYGPTFGSGFDLYVADTLATGVVYNLSYGDATTGDNSLTIEPYHSVGAWFNVGRMEVYTFETAASAVPEPGSMALLSLGGIGLVGGAVRRRLRKQPA